jgi:hypothetical protein
MWHQLVVRGPSLRRDDKGRKDKGRIDNRPAFNAASANTQSTAAVADTRLSIVSRYEA